MDRERFRLKKSPDLSQMLPDLLFTSKTKDKNTYYCHLMMLHEVDYLHKVMLSSWSPLGVTQVFPQDFGRSNIVETPKDSVYHVGMWKHLFWYRWFIIFFFPHKIQAGLFWMTHSLTERTPLQNSTDLGRMPEIRKLDTQTHTPPCAYEVLSPTSLRE